MVYPIGAQDLPPVLGLPLKPGLMGELPDGDLGQCGVDEQGDLS